MLRLHTYSLIVLLCPLILNALPANNQNPPEKEGKAVQTSPVTSWGVTWSYYNVAAVTTAVVVVGATILTVFFFPIFVYKICYALGGCQNTLDAYVDKFIGVEGTTRKINKRSADYLVPTLTLLYNAYEKYYDPSEESNDRSVNKRSLEYIEPLFEILSKALTDYAEPDDPKKNFNKERSYRR